MRVSEEQFNEMLRVNTELGIVGRRRGPDAKRALDKMADRIEDIVRPHISEHQAQAAVMQWVKDNESRHPALRMVFAVPNGGKRPPKTGAKLKREGLRRGVPDLLIPYRTSEFVGMAIEMKVGRNVTSPEQDWWLGELRAQGWYCVVAYGADEAVREIRQHFGIE